MSQMTVSPPLTEHDTDPALLAAILRPYRDHCRYLKEAVVSTPGPVTARCSFEIPESCYIDDTGHFNSVEFNICYNQMMYYLMAKSVQERLTRPFSAWSMDDYWNRQLGNFLITDFRSSFRSQMDSRHFMGELVMDRVIERLGEGVRNPMVIIYTSCRYWDDNGGSSHGTVKVAITAPPTA